MQLLLSKPIIGIKTIIYYYFSLLYQLWHSKSIIQIIVFPTHYLHYDNYGENNNCKKPQEAARNRGINLLHHCTTAASCTINLLIKLLGPFGSFREMKALLLFHLLFSAYIIAIIAIITLLFALFVSQTIFTIIFFCDYYSAYLFPHILYLLLLLSHYYVHYFYLKPL